MLLKIKTKHYNSIQNLLLFYFVKLVQLILVITVGMLFKKNRRKRTENVWLGIEIVEMATENQANKENTEVLEMGT